jgi:hypothetical protein
MDVQHRRSAGKESFLIATALLLLKEGALIGREEKRGTRLPYPLFSGGQP